MKVVIGNQGKNERGRSPLPTPTPPMKEGVGRKSGSFPLGIQLLAGRS